MFWQVEAINISMIDLRIVFRLYCFFKVCPYTHFHFKCRSAMLICINFNRSVMNPHNFPHHRKAKSHTSEFSLQFGSTWYPLIPDDRLTL